MCEEKGKREGSVRVRERVRDSGPGHNNSLQREGGKEGMSEQHKIQNLDEKNVRSIPGHHHNTLSLNYTCSAPGLTLEASFF